MAKPSRTSKRENLTDLGKQIIATDQIRIKLDKVVKNIFAYKPLLARIFKEVVVECKDMSYAMIERCIEGRVQISKVRVNSGLSNVGERIEGLSTENIINDEGVDYYDIRTYLLIPDDHKMIKLLINVEIQNDENPGYDISLRALFYCCRMISAQQSVEFTTDKDDKVKYGNIKKVYSIWICSESAQKRANTIESYRLNREFLLGKNNDNPRYDILNATIIYLSKTHEVGDTENKMIRMLTDLLDERIEGKDKIDRLREYDLPVTKKIEKEIGEMCTYATAIENKGYKKGKIEGEKKGMKKGLQTGIERLAEHYMKEDPTITEEKAYSMARAIIGDKKE